MPRFFVRLLSFVDNLRGSWRARAKVEELGRFHHSRDWLPSSRPTDLFLELRRCWIEVVRQLYFHRGGVRQGAHVADVKHLLLLLLLNFAWDRRRG